MSVKTRTTTSRKTEFSTVSKTRMSAKVLAITSMMIAVTIILMITPIGTIKLPLVSVTIAHIPAIITALVIGPREGVAVAFAMGISSMVMALVSPGSVFDPFFVNPLVSVLPRVLIPVTAFYSYKAIRRLLKIFKAGEYIAVPISVVIGNLTNTFGVYTMLYLVYARRIFEKTGKDALGMIIAAVSTTTVIKCVIVVIIVTPIVYTLKRVYSKTPIKQSKSK